jgi:small subunit ribosomal protein S11|uniref:Ribosomal protein S11 n=1 Tax=Poterioochromonas malhamensis TaxID=88167 RepID=A0A7T6Y893_9STRA|nr:ribosomal protein S11 [Poterioochromonas malhamensis]QQK54984.1 ribosomal protein S11 [Poterioochromonas malhamensis]
MSVSKKKSKKLVKSAVFTISTTSNNTLITVTDYSNSQNSICWSSAGICGLKGTKKSTPFASQIVAKNIATKALDFGIKEIYIILKGVGKGRHSCVKALQSFGFKVLGIEEKISLPHNGCRPPKRRKL